MKKKTDIGTFSTVKHVKYIKTKWKHFLSINVEKDILWNIIKNNDMIHLITRKGIN